MIESSSAKLIGTALIVSEDAMATRQLTEAMNELALSVEVCIKVTDALDRLKHSKFEVCILDFSLGNQARYALEQVRASASNRTVVTFAITGSSAETRHALVAGSSFTLERPLTLDSIRNTLNAAYGLIVRERRRYFRYPVSVPAAVSIKGASEIFGTTINISESGMAFHAPTPLIPGTDVMMQFTLRNPPIAVTAECRVRWSNDKGEVGLQYLYLPSDLSSKLQAWLAQRLEERLPASVTRGIRRGEDTRTRETADGPTPFLTSNRGTTRARAPSVSSVFSALRPNRMREWLMKARSWSTALIRNWRRQRRAHHNLFN